MANAESPDPSKDLVTVENKDEEVDPVAPAPEPKLPTRKDASLKEFLGKMDDYAPIVSCFTTSEAGLSNPFRFPMRSPTIISQKLACLLHLKQTRVLLASSPWPPRSSLQT